MKINETYLDIPTIARKKIMTEEQYNKRIKYFSHKAILQSCIDSFHNRMKAQKTTECVR